MATNIAEGTLTADGTEQTLGNTSAAGVYRVIVDAVLMQAGDTTILRGKMKVLSTSTERTPMEVTLTDAQSEPDELPYSFFFVAPQGVTFTLEQTGGVNRQYPFSVDKIADLTVIDSNTVTLDGTEQTLSTQTDNDEYVLLTDHNESIGGDTVRIRMKAPVLSGGTARTLDLVDVTGVQATPDIIRQSIPEVSPHSLTATVEKTAGANHDIDWALCTLG